MPGTQEQLLAMALWVRFDVRVPSVAVYNLANGTVECYSDW